MGDGLSTAALTTIAVDGEWLRGARRARRLASVSLAWLCFEGAATTTAALDALTQPEPTHTLDDIDGRVPTDRGTAAAISTDSCCRLVLRETRPAGRLAGALTRADFRATLQDAGSEDIEIRETHRVHEHAASAILRALKPAL